MGRLKRLEYTAPTGDVFDLIGNREHMVVAAGISGLVGQTVDVVDEALGVAGQVPRAIEVEPLTGSLTIRVEESSWRRVRAAFMVDRHGTLLLDAGGGPWRLRVRASATPGPPEMMPGAQPSEQLMINLVSDEGLWWSEWRERSGFVTVSNSGPVDVWPQVRWQGAGRWLELPSGMRVDLPDTSGERVLLLDPGESYAVLDGQGQLDRPMWKQFRGHLFPEGVPPYTQREYQASDGVTVEWRTATLDPWR